MDKCLSMSVVRAYLSGNPVHDRVIKAFAEGCGASLHQFDEYELSDVAVIFGVFKSRVPISWPRGEVFRRQRQNNLDVVVLETGYINRGDGETHHYAAGFNGLNGRADFRNQGMPPDRLRNLGVKLGQWRWLRYGDILLCGQVPWDASVDHSDHIAWLNESYAQLNAVAKGRVVFRPHPLAKNAYPLLPCRYSEGPMSEALANASVVVTFNSNSAVEAVLEGVPSIACDPGSMAWAVTGHTLGEVVSPPMEDRAQWAANLAYCQWTLEEMKSGEAWAHLSR